MCSIWLSSAIIVLAWQQQLSSVQINSIFKWFVPASREELHTSLFIQAAGLPGCDKRWTDNWPSVDFYQLIKELNSLKTYDLKIKQKGKEPALEKNHIKNQNVIFLNETFTVRRN